MKASNVPACESWMLVDGTIEGRQSGTYHCDLNSGSKIIISITQSQYREVHGVVIHTGQQTSNKNAASTKVRVVCLCLNLFEWRHSGKENLAAGDVRKTSLGTLTDRITQNRMSHVCTLVRGYSRAG